MQIVVRGYRPEDAAQVLEVMRDSYGTLRASRGGKHPDEGIDTLFSMPDSDRLALVTRGSRVLVAEVAETGQIAGIGAFIVTPLARLLGATYSKSMMVREAFQRGKCGVNVGTMIRLATLERAKKEGFRKIFGFSAPEAINFHKKFGAVFHPQYNRTYMGGKVEVHYYEIILRPSLLNKVRLEVLVHRMFTMHAYAKERLKKILPVRKSGKS